jgi:F0F1-type ATP synthase alpha subunit
MEIEEDISIPFQFGRVIKVADGIAQVEGCYGIKAGELVRVVNTMADALGLALNIEKNNVSIVFLCDDHLVSEGDLVRRVGTRASIACDLNMLGHVVNALGIPIDFPFTKQPSVFLSIESKAPGILERRSVFEPVNTGIKVIDALVPIGRGQRELIIGDRQTGEIDKRVKLL